MLAGSFLVEPFSPQSPSNSDQVRAISRGHKADEHLTATPQEPRLLSLPQILAARFLLVRSSQDTTLSLGEKNAKARLEVPDQ